jgi:hypothetical protein
MMSNGQEEQTPEQGTGKEDKPEVFIPVPTDKVSLNSQDDGKAQKP